jgi:DNA-binding CsgD family transcriptional regulator
MAHAVDRMREIRSAARVVGDAVAGVVVTRGGSAVRLPGLPDHRVLAPGSPVLAEAAGRLDAGDPYAVFLHPAPDGGATRLLRISVLDCRGGGVDHLRGVVLVSKAPDLGGLTRQDLDILGFVVAGATDERIAVALEISTQAVAERIRRIRQLLAAPSRTGLAVRALRDGLFIPRRVLPGREDPSRTESSGAFEDS